MTQGEIITYIKRRLDILTDAERKYTAHPNPWGHRKAELELLLEEIHLGEVPSR